MKTRQSKYCFALAHSEVRNKPQVYFHKLTYITTTQCVKRRLHKRSLIQPVWSNYRSAGCMWPGTAFSVARGIIQKKTSNLKFVEKRVRLHLFHWIACAR